MILLLMGVAGSGKTTIGGALASRLGWDFADADDYHSAANVRKMASGVPLTDEDRAPWLEALRKLIVSWIEAGRNGVLACSALKQSYRDMLVFGPDVVVVYLKASRGVLDGRLRARHEHYMHVSMLDSQLETLEEPSDAMVIDAQRGVEEIVGEILKRLERRSVGGGRS